MTCALFERDGNIWIPDESGVGPWSPTALHGGPVAALCVSVAEELLPGDQWVTTRLTLDFIRPVPLRPLTVSARVAKQGRRVSLVSIDVADGTRAVVSAQVQRTAERRIELPPLRGTGVEMAPPDDGPQQFQPLDASAAPNGPAPFFRDATEMRVPADRPLGFLGPHPSPAWVRVVADLLRGVPLSTSAAVAAAADYGNALGSPEAPGTRTAFPNADLSVHLTRTPAEAWVRMSPTSTWQDNGIGHTRCDLTDRQGLLGTSSVTLVLDNLPK